MANRRITYATAQLSLKDNRADATDYILGWLPDITLASGITSSETGLIYFNEEIPNSWPASGQIRVKTGSNRTEYVRYDGVVDTSGLNLTTRGTGGTDAGAHNQNDVTQLLGWEVPLGVQSVSVGTTFNTEDVFHIGQLDPYENVEGIPDIEVTTERVLDGTKPMWLTGTDFDFVTLKGRTAEYKADIAVSVYPDTQDSATGTPDSNMVASGMVVSAWALSMPTDGNFTESMTFVGNDKTWGGEEGTPSGFFLTADAYNAAVIGSGVSRSEDFDVANSTLPADVSSFEHIQSIDVAVDITREEIFELGSKTPFFRAVSFPVSVTTTIEAITDQGDLVTVLGNGRDNLIDRTIVLKTKGGLKVNLAGQNKLSSLTFEGFDAGGGNGTVTYEYTNSNALTITHDAFLSAFDTNTDLL
jgi:hypothetical protein